jgi:HupE / UreJ protein
MTRLLVVILAVAALLGARQAGAHAVNLAVAFITVQDARVVIDLTITGSEIDRAAGVNVTNNATGMVDPRRLREAAPTFERYITQRTTVSAAGAPCPMPSIRSSAESDQGVSVMMVFECPGAAAIRYRSRAMVDFDPAARQSVMLNASGEFEQAALLDANSNEVLLTGGPLHLIADVLWRYFVLGVEHIATGYDHILFLIAVILWARRIGALVKIVTAFTIAHSITLTLAALGWVRVAGGIIEPLIALTIIWVAVENFWSRDTARRWRWTFALGLVHGFGFAGVLQEIGLPRGALVSSLASFNLGVEAGQLVIVAVLLPVLLLLDRLLARSAPVERRPALVYPLSALIAVAGLFWLLERTVFA